MGSDEVSVQELERENYLLREVVARLQEQLNEKHEAYCEQCTHCNSIS